MIDVIEQQAAKASPGLKVSPEAIEMTGEELANQVEAQAIEKLEEMIQPQDQEIPDEFICPITLEVMTDPVFSEGHTYERSAIEEHLENAKLKKTNPINPMTGLPMVNTSLTPHTELKDKIEQFKSNQHKNDQPGVKEESPKSEIQPEQEENKPIPDELICPITIEIMIDPVLCLSSGKAYERSAITKWIETNPTCPLTRRPLTQKDIIPNDDLKRQIAEFLKENPQHKPVESQQNPDSKEMSPSHEDERKSARREITRKIVIEIVGIAIRRKPNWLQDEYKQFVAHKYKGYEQLYYTENPKSNLTFKFANRIDANEFVNSTVKKVLNSVFDFVKGVTEGFAAIGRGLAALFEPKNTTSSASTLKSMLITSPTKPAPISSTPFSRGP